MNEQLISIFDQVRDIPYKIPISIGEKDCCCNGKHIMLKKAFENLGYECRYRVVSFKWSSLNLPSELYKISHEDDSTHVYLEVKIGGEWINVDATWDRRLSKVFKINEWDGESNTQIAVPVVKLFSHKESDDIMADNNEESIREDLKKNGEFYKAFNGWLAINRN
jgi:hypothetical protein